MIKNGKQPWRRGMEEALPGLFLNSFCNSQFHNDAGGRVWYTGNAENKNRRRQALPEKVRRYVG